MSDQHRAPCPDCDDGWTEDPTGKPAECGTCGGTGWVDAPEPSDADQ